MPLAFGSDADAKARQMIVKEKIGLLPGLCALYDAFGQLGHGAHKIGVVVSIP